MYPYRRIVAWYLHCVITTTRDHVSELCAGGVSDEHTWRDVPDHSILRSHHLDFVWVVIQFARVGREQFVHDARICHEVRPEADSERFDLHCRPGRICFLSLLNQVASERQHAEEAQHNTLHVDGVTQAVVLRWHCADVEPFHSAQRSFTRRTHMKKWRSGTRGRCSRST